MSLISGFGNAVWAPFMSSVSFSLEGTDAHIVIRPADMSGPNPSWWPGEAAKILMSGERVTLEKIQQAFPDITSVDWSDKVASMVNGVERFGVFGDLRATIVSHIPGTFQPTSEQRAAKFSDLSDIGDEFIAMVNSRA